MLKARHTYVAIHFLPFLHHSFEVGSTKQCHGTVTPVQRELNQFLRDGKRDSGNVGPELMVLRAQQVRDDGDDDDLVVLGRSWLDHPLRSFLVVRFGKTGNWSRTSRCPSKKTTTTT